VKNEEKKTKRNFAEWKKEKNKKWYEIDKIFVFVFLKVFSCVLLFSFVALFVLVIFYQWLRHFISSVALLDFESTGREGSVFFGPYFVDYFFMIFMFLWFLGIFVFFMILGYGLFLCLFLCIFLVFRFMILWFLFLWFCLMLVTVNFNIFSCKSLLVQKKH